MRSYITPPPSSRADRKAAVVALRNAAAILEAEPAAGLTGELQIVRAAPPEAAPDQVTGLVARPWLDMIDRETTIHLSFNLGAAR